MEYAVQLTIFLALTALVAWLTWRRCRRAEHASDASKEYFLAGGGLRLVAAALHPSDGDHPRCNHAGHRRGQPPAGAQAQA